MNPGDIAMPVLTGGSPEHRVKLPDHVFAYYALTARDVNRAERASNPDAQAALKKEWDRLRGCGDMGCWDETHPGNSMMSRENIVERVPRRTLGECLISVWKRIIICRWELPGGSTRVVPYTRATMSGIRTGICHISGNGVLPVDNGGIQGG